MTFVNLSLLIGGGALMALPIVLHLIMRRKPRHHEFPALRFIQKKRDTNQRRLRLRHLLLLLLRMTAIGLLAFALARPSMKLSGSFGSQKAPVAAAFVFDSSMRMQYAHENRTRLDQATELGHWLMGRLPKDSQIAVLDSRPTTAAFQVDASSAKFRLERMESTSNARSLSHTLDEAVRLLGTSDLGRREIYIFTDMARSSWPTDMATGIQLRLAELAEVGIYVVDVGVPNPVNAALGPLRLQQQVLAEGSSLRMETEVTHLGRAGKRTVELYFFDSQPASRTQDATSAKKRSEQIVDLESAQAVQVNFSVGGLQRGTHQGFVRVVGQDGLECDNQRWFTVRVQPAWKILLVAPNPIEDHAYFLNQALAPASFRRAGLADFECETIAYDRLPAKQWQAFDAVFLLDPPPLDARVWESLTDYVSAGHGLAIALGRNAKPNSFNQRPAQELLAGPLVSQARASGNLYLFPRDVQHPSLVAFRGLEDSIPWQMSPVFRYWQLGEMAEGVHIVAPFSDGRPAILDRAIGRGHAITVTTPFSDLPNQKQRPWNLMPVGQAAITFVMLTDSMARYLVGSSDQNLNYTAGQTAVLKLDPNKQLRSYTLATPTDIDLRLTPDLTRNLLSVTSTDATGNYRVRAGGYDDPVDLGFSVNLAPEQTRLERLADEDLKSIFGKTPYRVARDRDEIEVGVTTGRVGRELFPLLIVLLAIVLGVEYAISNRFYRA